MNRFFRAPFAGILAFVNEFFPAPPARPSAWENGLLEFEEENETLPEPPRFGSTWCASHHTTIANCYPEHQCDELPESEPTTVSAGEKVHGRPPGFYVCMTIDFASREYGFPNPLWTGDEHVASDGGVWIFNNLGTGEWDAVSYPTGGDPYAEIKARERASQSSPSPHGDLSRTVAASAETCDGAVSVSPTPAPSQPNPNNDGLRALCDVIGVPYSVIADCFREIADDLDPVGAQHNPAK